jgi:uncharacterized protein (DUF1697 family)
MSDAVVVLLRGINVTGSGKMRMEDLRALCASLGLRDVRTYIQSGNIVFRGAITPVDLEAAIAAELGVRTTAIFRSAADLRDIVDKNPFPGLEPTKLVVDFLSGHPVSTALPPTDPERLHLRGRDLYIHFPLGQGPSKLPLAKIEKSLGVTGTCRNWNTVRKLLEMAV